MKAKNRFIAFTYAALLAAFTGLLALDTFVLPHGAVEAGGADTTIFTQTVQDTGTTSAENGRISMQSQPASAQADTGITALEQVADTPSYSDENVQITLQTYRVQNTDIYVADVILSSAEYLKTAFADSTFGRNITAKTSEIAAENNAVLAVNGDFCGARDTGTVIRNGILYRDASSGSDIFCLFADGHAEVRSGTESAQELLAAGVWQAWCFGPALLENGRIMVGTGDEVGRAMQSNPRTAIGVVSDLHYVLVVSDGRTSASGGLSLCQLAEFMQGLGVQTAYNLDGGGSSTMVFNGTVVNNPTTSGRKISERSVSDIIYIGRS